MALDRGAIEAAVQEQYERQAFSGVVHVREAGTSVYAKAFGQADRVAALPNTLTTRFGTASGTKTFTAVAVCQLIESGALDLQSRLADVVGEDLPRFDPGITVEQLLTHTSGAPDYFDEEGLDAQGDFGAAFGDIALDQVRRPADILPLFADLPMKSAPGARFHYNNGGFVLLGLVIEAASGQPYADYVEKQVFARAGMGDAGFFELDRLPSRTAIGYLPNGRPNTTELTIKGMPDGGAYVTAHDMAAFWDALLCHQLLGPEMTAASLRPHVAVGSTESEGSHYGYGVWLTAADASVSRVTCSGADPGVAFMSCYWPADGVELTVLGNTEKEAWPLVRAVVRLIEGSTPP